MLSYATDLQLEFDTPETLRLGVGRFGSGLHFRPDESVRGLNPRRARVGCLWRSHKRLNGGLGCSIPDGRA